MPIKYVLFVRLGRDRDGYVRHTRAGSTSPTIPFSFPAVICMGMHVYIYIHFWHVLINCYIYI